MIMECPTEQLSPLETTTQPIEDSFSYDQGRAFRVETTLHGFSDRFLSRLAINAATRQELFDHVAFGTHQAPMAARAIYDYWITELKSQDKIRYEASLAHDFKQIDATAQHYANRLATTHEGTALLEQMERGEIDAAYWSRGKIGIHVPELASMAGAVNVEAMLGRAAYTLDCLMHTESGSSEQFALVQEMETVYMPLHDILGQSASEMMERSLVGKARLIAAGLGDNVALAERRIEEINNVHGQEVVLQSLFGACPERPIFEAPTDTQYGEQIHYAVYDLAEATKHRWEGRLFVRTKTVGSLADKMVNNAAYATALPQDIIGIKIVVPDVTQLAECMQYVMETVEHSGQLTPVVAASKTRSVFAQGHPAYLAQLEQHMDPAAFASIQTHSLQCAPDEGFQVIKATCHGVSQGVLLPVEIQGLTYDDRSRERHDAPHFLAPKSSRTLPGMPPHVPASGDALRVIHARKRDLVKGDVTDTTPLITANGLAYSRDVLRYARVTDEVPLIDIKA